MLIFLLPLFGLELRMADKVRNLSAALKFRAARWDRIGQRHLAPKSRKRGRKKSAQLDRGKKMTKSRRSVRTERRSRFNERLENRLECVQSNENDFKQTLSYLSKAHFENSSYKEAPTELYQPIITENWINNELSSVQIV